jgi:hypothetical protein
LGGKVITSGEERHAPSALSNVYVETWIGIGGTQVRLVHRHAAAGIRRMKHEAYAAPCGLLTGVNGSTCPMN